MASTKRPATKKPSATEPKATKSAKEAKPKPSSAKVALSKEPRLRLAVGDPAPAFSATVTDGSMIHSKDLLGTPVVLYFYPRDDTPGCTKEACGFRDAHAAIRKTGAVVLGVSADPVKSHVKFTDKYQLPFVLISDPDAVVAKAFGAWGEKVFMGRRYQGMHRMTFLIGANGRIARLWETVKPEVHAEEVLAALRAG